MLGQKMAQGENAFHVLELQQFKDMQMDKIAEMQRNALDANERMLEAERRVAAGRLMVEIVKKAKNDRIKEI